MKKKIHTPLKDALTGAAMGTAIIIPGISGGTIALILGAIDKITGAVKNLFTKKFWQNVLILLPFILGMVAAVGALYFPFKIALDEIRFSLICLFAGLIIGSFPIITREVSDKKPAASNFIQAFIGLTISVLIGVFSVIFEFSSTISALFLEIPGYLFLLIFAIGVVSAAGLIVPGLSGSLILLVISFYKPIFDLFQFNNGLKDFALLAIFAVGVGIGFILWSILMNKVLSKHRRGTIFVVIGFIIGSLFSIFFNSEMMTWYHGEKFGLLEWILGPSLLIVGFVLSILFSKYVKKNIGEKNA